MANELRKLELLLFKITNLNYEIRMNSGEDKDHPFHNDHINKIQKEYDEVIKEAKECVKQLIEEEDKKLEDT